MFWIKLNMPFLLCLFNSFLSKFDFLNFLLAVLLWKCSFHVRKSDFFWFIKVWIRAQNIQFLGLEYSVFTYFYYREIHFHMVIVIKCQKEFSFGVFVLWGFWMSKIRVQESLRNQYIQSDMTKIYLKYYLWRVFQINEAI